MLNNPDYITAHGLLLDAVSPTETERIPLSESGGRVLARDLTAAENIPPFDRSPYDGYALRASDIAGASKERPAVLRLLEEIPAGTVPAIPLTAGTASKVLTGTPIPEGADAVIQYELTESAGEWVRVFAPLKSGENIVRAGEDVRKGDILARRGDVIDPGTAGTLASLGIPKPEVYRKPRIGILSIGSELVEADGTPGPGEIRNSNCHMLEAALHGMGCESFYLGIAGDSAEEICALIRAGVAGCDAVVSTGGVSVGDYDLTPDAMEMAGAELLFRGVAMKPGMACAYGVCNGKLLCGLSGNPASALTNFYAVAQPALRKLMGCREPLPRGIRVRISGDFRKKSPRTRFLRGKLELRDGTACMVLPGEQGNVVLSSAIGCDAMAVVSPGSGPISGGTVLEGFLI